MPDNELETVALEDLLLEQNKLHYEKEIAILDSLSTTWNWNPDTLSGGILLERIPSTNTAANSLNHNAGGDTVVLKIDVKLANGNRCFSDDSLHLIIDHFDGAQMFDVIAKNISSGDSCRALVPSSIAYGVRGLPGYVPPGAMLLVDVRQH